MKILFVIPGGKLVPSGQVRILNYGELFSRSGIDFDVANFQSTVQLRLERARSRLSMTKTMRSWCEFQVLRIVNRLVSPVHSRRFRRKILHACQTHDAIFVQWNLLPEDLLKVISASQCRLIFDFDDAVFLVDPEGFGRMAKESWCLVAGSAYNFSYARKIHQNVVHVPSAVDLREFPEPETAPSNSKSGPLTIGWVGGVSTVKYLHQVAGALSELAGCGRDFRLLLAGTGHTSDLPDFRGVDVQLVRSYSSRDLGRIAAAIDIGIMPLSTDEWAKGKCAMKFLVYGAAGKPCVASPVGEITRIAEEGRTVLFASSDEEWTRKLALLLDSHELRCRLGRNARKTVEESFSLEVCFKRLKHEVLDPLQHELDT